MSTLTDTEKRYFEKILDMGSGYVLDFSDAAFGEFFGRFQVDIHAVKYQRYGTSKAKKLRAFWEHESDLLVGRVMTELLSSYEAKCDLSGTSKDAPLLDKARAIVARLKGHAAPTTASQADPVETFLHEEFKIPNIDKLPIEGPVAQVIAGRLAEARLALAAKAYLSVIFLCGSVLEAVLLGAALKSPAMFNRSASSPKDSSGEVKQFPEWSLAQLIDVACDIGVLKPDIQKFGHGLRDFRNYIHPYQQVMSGFTPDEHTAKVCFQVLKAALASVAGERK